MADSQDPRQIWESLTPAIRWSALHLAQAGYTTVGLVISRCEAEEMYHAGLACYSDGGTHIRSTALCRAVAAAGAEQAGKAGS